MEKFNRTINSLKTLLELQQDRAEGYAKAIEEVGRWDIDLKMIFDAMIEQSEKHQDELVLLLNQQGEFDFRHKQSLLSELHQFWMEIKKMFSKRDREAIMESCIYGEKVIIGAYENEIAQDFLPQNISDALSKQLVDIKNAKSAILSNHKSEKMSY